MRRIIDKLIFNKLSSLTYHLFITFKLHNKKVLNVPIIAETTFAFCILFSFNETKWLKTESLILEVNPINSFPPKKLEL